MGKLSGLKPEAVFGYFEELCAIPHGSGHTDTVSRWLTDFAAKNGLSAQRDEYNNVIIRKPASPGYEDHPTVILQGHMDMVWDKDPDCPVDLAKDGLDVDVDGDWVFAHGTTLGGDDGIAVAMAMAILTDDTLPHPPLEVLITSDEETGMDGAAGLDASRLTGRTLINIDSEEEGVLTVGCAGGARADITLPAVRLPSSGDAYRVTVGGLIGGHSGVEIDKGRLNADVLLGRFLCALPAGWRLSAIEGGARDNAIPRQAAAVIFTQSDPAPLARAFCRENTVPADPGLTVTAEKVPAPAAALSPEDSRRMADFLAAVKNGVQAMSRELPGLVETSLNLGVLRLTEDGLTASFSVRSSKSGEKTALLRDLEAAAAAYGGTVTAHGHYPAWEYRRESPLRETMVAAYRELTKKEPTVMTIHAGLECGILGEKLPGLDAVSFGPEMQNVHTSRERLSVSSVERTYRYLLEVLKRL